MSAEIIIETLNYVGIIAFAISGALKAGEKGMDLLGFLTLGFSTALAGGIMRDVLLGRVPPVNVVYLPYPLTALTASLLAFFLYPYVKRFKDYVLYPDAVGLGAFAAIGADITANYCPAHGGKARLQLERGGTNIKCGWICLREEVFEVYALLYSRVVA